MPNRQLHLAAYDVRDPKRLSAALHLVRSHATGGQKSVHELFLSVVEKAGLLLDMNQLLENEDRFILLRLDARASVLTHGKANAPADPDYFYLG